MMYGAHASYYNNDQATNCDTSCDPSHHTTPKCHFSHMHLRLTGNELQWALFHLYTIATKEVEKFHPADKVRKFMTKQAGILYHKSRIINGQRWTTSTGKDINELLAQGLNLFLPVVDRWSPIAYSIGLWIHREVSNHSGFETTYRHSLNFCFVTHGSLPL